MRPWILLLALVAACVPVRRRANTDLVHHVSFRGNGGLLSGQNDYQLRAQMLQHQSRFGLLLWPLVYTVDPVTLDRTRLLRDGYRLEVWYAHHGWFDAKVLGWQIRQIRPERNGKAAVVNVIGVVDPGLPSTVRGLEIEGPPWMQALSNAVLHDAPIHVGDRYDRDLLEQTRKALVVALEKQAHPYATVSLTATAHPEDRAVDVVLHAEPGIEGRIGEIRIAGNKAVSDKLVDQALKFDTGDPYSIANLQKAQQRLFGLGTFSLVTVDPDLSDPTREDVPIDVQLTESRFRTFRLGGGGEFDIYTFSARASARLTHVNLFHTLLRAEVGAQVGFALDVAASESNPVWFPTYDFDLGLRYPHLFGPRGSIELTGHLQQDIYVGLWNYRRVLTDLSYTYQFTDRIRLKVGPHFEDYVFLDQYGHRVFNANAEQQLFGLSGDTNGEYRLSAIDQVFSLDRRNDPIQPSRGTLLALAAREAVPISDIGFGFVRGSVGLSGYVPVRAKDRGAAYPVTLGGHGEITAVAPYGSTTDIPLPERAFLGGSTSIRGFRPNSVGPYTVFCNYTKPDHKLSRYDIPEGGNAAVQASAEVRYDWIYGITLAAFADGGALWTSPAPITSDLLRYSAGVGLRYNTLVGPIRFDLSFRPLFPEDYTTPPFVGCDGGDQVPRIYDFFGLFSDPRFPSTHPPFAMVFFLTLGEAF